MATYNIDQIIHTRSNNTSDTYVLVDTSARSSITTLSNQVNQIQTKVDLIPDSGNPYQTSGSTDSIQKLYLTGAIAQSNNEITYSNENVYTRAGVLYANSYVDNNSSSNPNGSNGVLTWYDIYTGSLEDSNSQIPTSKAIRDYINLNTSINLNWVNGITSGAVRMRNTIVEELLEYYMGTDSTAEGNNTKAVGDYSHVEGYYNNALYRSQHVFGEYNEEDPAENTSYYQRGNYVEIVGNGFENNRSNARTLDWDGNETLAGKLTLGLGGTEPEDAPNISQVESALSMLCTTSGTTIGALNITFGILTEGE